MVDYILEIPTLIVFGVKCFDCDNTKLCLRNNPAWNKDDIEAVIYSHVDWDTLRYQQFMNKLNLNIRGNWWQNHVAAP